MKLEIHNEDCIQGLSKLDDNSVDLVITSPPYCANKEFENFKSIEEYNEFLIDIFKLLYQKLKIGGRICWQSAFTIAKPRHSPIFEAYIAGLIAGFKYRDFVIWFPQSTLTERKPGAGNTGWGSWRSPSNPTIRGMFQGIIIFDKDIHTNKPNGRKSDLESQEFMNLTRSVWFIPQDKENQCKYSERKHSLPFPVKLATNCIKLNSYVGDTVLDPFLGTGTTLVACKQLNRNGIGYEINPEYCKIAKERLQQEVLSAKI